MKALPIFLVVFVILVVVVSAYKNATNKNIISQIIPTTTPFEPFPYKPPTIPVKRSYLTVLVGDSMTYALGLNANELRLDLIKLYPTHEFVNYNYGFPSTNILTLADRLNKSTTSLGSNFPPILTQGFDLMIIESFAYNPLSQFPVDEGVKKYTETLDAAVREIMQKHPESVIALMTPIAPNKENFAKNAYKLDQATRTTWVNERIAYINAMIAYAKDKNIPLIDVYAKSQTANGDGDLKYINSDDYIHPSKLGVKLMSDTISQFIFENKIFPN